MLVTDKSTDDVKEAANEALAAGNEASLHKKHIYSSCTVTVHSEESPSSGVSIFPIGVGPGYDRSELGLLGHRGNQDNSLHLNSMDQLLMLLTLDRGYTEKICRGTYSNTFVLFFLHVFKYISQK